MYVTGDGKPRSAAMVLSMPHTSLTAVLDILNENVPLSKPSPVASDIDDENNRSSYSEGLNADGQTEGVNASAHVQSSPESSNMFAIDPVAFDTVEASCKYDIYLQKQEDEMTRWGNITILNY